MFFSSKIAADVRGPRDEVFELLGQVRGHDTSDIRNVPV
jgi:hypothetical protein